MYRAERGAYVAQREANVRRILQNIDELISYDIPAIDKQADLEEVLHAVQGAIRRTGLHTQVEDTQLEDGATSRQQR